MCANVRRLLHRVKTKLGIDTKSTSFITCVRILFTFQDDFQQGSKTVTAGTMQQGLTGSYCNLASNDDAQGKNLSRKTSQTSPTVYARIDPVATIGATQVIYIEYCFLSNCFCNQK